MTGPTHPRGRERATPSAGSSAATRADTLGVSGSAVGSVRLLLQAEGLAVLLVAATLYRQGGTGWGLFAALFLVPDVSFVAYLAGPRLGAITYNALHSYVGPMAIALLVLSGAAPSLLPYACIWAAHIGFDRLMRYGLKYPGDFHHTHLGSKRRLA